MVPFMKRNSKPASEVANERLAPSAWVLIPVLWSGPQPLLFVLLWALGQRLGTDTPPGFALSVTPGRTFG